MSLAVVATLVVFLGAGAAQDPQAPAGGIHGRVTDGQTGTPLAGAAVRLSLADSRTSFNTVTNADGRYSFAGLPAGTYFGYVDRGAYKATHMHGILRRPGNQRLVLKEGEVLRDIDVALERSRAIVVTVIDEWGEPLSGLSVRANDARTRQPAPIGFLQQTDDRGRLRLYGLASGTYVLCAEPGPGLTFSSGHTKTTERFLITCHPSAASPGDAEPVRVDGVLSEVTIRMRRGKTFRISGSVLDATGAPAPHARMSLQKHFRNGSTGIMVRLAADASFSVDNIVPGEYSLTASVDAPGQQHRPVPIETAYTHFNVADGDVDNVVLAMARTVTVAGRIVLEDPAMPLPKTGAPLHISPRLVLDGSSQWVGAAYMESEREFLVPGMFGKRILDVANLPRGWYVKSVLYQGKEIADVPTEFKATPDRALEIVLSTRGATIAGRVLDERGEPVGGAQLVVVPTDRTRWGLSDSIAGRSSANGEYRIGPRRPGEYIVIALAGEAALVDSRDIDRIAEIAERGERIALGSTGELALDLQRIRR